MIVGSPPKSGGRKDAKNHGFTVVRETMTLKVREALVGKRFVSLAEGGGGVGEEGGPRSPCSEWDWRCGVIRAASSSSNQENKLKVLVEYDGLDWEQRQWIKINKVFKVFLVEEMLVWIPSPADEHSDLLKKNPALTFRTLVDKIGLRENPVEFLVDKRLEFVDVGTTVQAFKETDLTTDPPTCDDPVAVDCAKSWLEFQEGQMILLQTPSLVIGYRVEVYRSDGTTQWYTAVIKSFSESNQMISVTDDTVLEEHQVNPRIIQMNLLGDGVINSILRGEESGIRLSRTRRCKRVQYTSTSSSALTSSGSTGKASGKAKRFRSSAPGELETVAGVENDDLKTPGGDTEREPTIECDRIALLDISTIAGIADLWNKSSSSGYSSENSDRNISSRKKLLRRRKLLRSDKAVADEIETNSPSSTSSPPIADESSASQDKNQTLKSLPDETARTVTQDDQEKGKNEADPSCMLTDGNILKTTQESLDLNSAMPKLKGPAANADYRNTSETQETEERFRLLKSVVSMQCNAMALMPPKTVADASTSVPGECLNLSAKPKHLMPVKANDSGDVNILGLNLNQSVTDQIAQRSREKPMQTTSTKRESSEPVNSLLVNSVMQNDRNVHEVDSKRVLTNVGGGGGISTAATLQNSSSLQQRNPNVLNGPSQRNSSPAVTNAKNPKPVNMNFLNELASKLSSNENKNVAPIAETMMPKFSAATDDARQNFGLNALPYSLPLLNQATAAAAVHQMSRGATPMLNQQTYLLNQLLLQNQLALQLEQQRLLEKQLQLQTSAGSVAPIFAAYPQYLPGAILSPEVFWLNCPERLREALLRQQQQQQQQQLNHASDMENNEGSAVTSGHNKSAKDASSAVAPENLKKVVTVPARSGLDSRNKEPVKEPVVEHSRDASQVLTSQMLPKRSEMILHGTVSDAIDQHFSESLRLAGQKPSSVVLPLGPDSRGSVAQPPDQKPCVISHDQHISKPKPQNSLMGLGHTEQTFLKDALKVKAEPSSLLDHGRASDFPATLNLPLELTSSCKTVAAPTSVLSSSIASLSSSSMSSVSVTTSSTGGSTVKNEPNFNIYGYQPCAIYLPQSTVDAQGLKDEKVPVRREQQDSKKACLDKLPLTVDAVNQSLMQLAPAGDDLRSRAVVEQKSVLMPGVGSNVHSSQKNERLGIMNLSSVPPERTIMSSTVDEGLPEGALNYVVAAAGSKGQAVFIPVLPILSNGQSVKMPTLKDCLSSKPLSSSKMMLGSESVASSMAHNAQTFSVQPPSVVAPDRNPNAMLSSLPISSAEAVYSFSLSHAQGLQSLLQNSVSPSNSLLATSSWPANASKRDYKTMAKESNCPSVDLISSDLAKRLKPNAADAMPVKLTPANLAPLSLTPADMVPMNLTPAAIAAASVVCSLPTSLFLSATCSANSTKMHLTYSDCFRSFVKMTNCKTGDTAKGQPVQGQVIPVSVESDRETVIVSNRGLEDVSGRDDKSAVLDLKLVPAVGCHGDQQSAFNICDGIRATNGPELNLGADSDTQSANSPTPMSLAHVGLTAPNTVVKVSEPVVQKQWQHTKFKKAWLQRYSDEDTTTNMTSAALDGDVDRKRELETDSTVGCSPFEDKDDNASNSVNNDATSVVSEQDSNGWTSATDSMSSCRVKKKRKSDTRTAKSEPPDKTSKLSSNADESTTGSSRAATKAQKKVKRRNNKEDEKEEEWARHNITAATDEEGIKSALSSGRALLPGSLNPQVSDCQAKILKRQDELKHSKCRDDPSFILANKALNSNSDEHHQQTMEVFLQDGACRDITPRLVKCRECKLARNKRDKRVPNDFCRFYAFRRLRYSPKRFLTTAGFSEPADADALDIELWMPMTPVVTPTLDASTARYIMMYAGSKFSNMVEQEREASSWTPVDRKVAWKRAVQGVREMCDVCDATLFNTHWVCEKCGFAVCINCFKFRTHRGGVYCRNDDCRQCESHKRRWLTCSANRQTHEPNQLMLAQIIPSDVLSVIGGMVEHIQTRFQLHSKSVFDENVPSSETKHEISKELESATRVKVEKNCPSIPTFSDLSLLAEAAAAQDAQQMGGRTNGSSGGARCSTLKDLLTKATSCCPSDVQKLQSSSTQSSLEEVIHKVMKLTSPDCKPKSQSHFIPCNRALIIGRPNSLPKFVLEQSTQLFPDVSHSWLNGGRLLQLQDPLNGKNVQLFQRQWQHGLPVVVANCHNQLDNSLWKPETISKEFGSCESQLVNCIDGEELSGQRMKKFWDGFERLSSRPKDKDGQPMVLKLKNWPPKDDFCELMPNHFQDLMHNLPLPEYTSNSGPFNLVSRLPEFFAKPDLGPKMYSAYGQAKHCHAGTTNLHLDVSDAFNLLVYVGIAKDDPEFQKSVTAAVESSGCCQLTKDRLKEPGTKPGAIWHIFDPDDGDKIRDMLNRVATERGDKVELHHDPIHDQTWYLDRGLRERLVTEYGVQCCTVIQCLGDAVFIPASAPHQVCNLNSCIKVASDFVSPENIDYCFKMAQECRHLSGETQGASHEDRLQVKNIIYHAVKDAVAVLGESPPSLEG